MSRPILVLDGDTAQALVVVRSLKRAGHRVVVAAPVEGARAARSRWVSEALIYPDPAASHGAFLSWLLLELKRRPYELLIPVTDWTLLPILSVRASVERLTRLAAAPTEAIEMAASKAATLSWATELDGLPSDGPWVVKPDRSKRWDSNGQGMSRSVVMVERTQQARVQARRWLPDGAVVLQRQVPGETVGINALAVEGEALLLFQYRRLHEVPLTGGASAYRESRPLEPVFADAVKRLLAFANWTGVAMFEFKREGQAWWLIECNGRFWGSLALPDAAGVDFPRALVELLLHGRRPERAQYPAGVRCRALAAEVEWFKGVLSAPAALRPPWSQVVRDTARALLPSERFDVLDLRDPVPGGFELYRLGRDVFWTVERKVKGLRLKRKLAQDRASPARLRETLARSTAILVLCAGNRMRSPYVGARLKAAGWPVEDAGLYAQAGRPVAPEVQAWAAARGLDLAAHRAKPVTPESLAAAQVVVVMEVEQALVAHLRLGVPLHKLVVLGALLDGPLDIADPDGGTAEDFARCLTRLDQAVDGLLRSCSR